MLAEHRVQVVVGEGGDRTATGVSADEVEQDVDPAEPIDDGGDCGLGRRPVGQVADADDPAIVGEPRRRCRRDEPLTVSAHEPETRAGFGEPVGDDGADAAAGSGDEDDAVGERHRLGTSGSAVSARRAYRQKERRRVL